MLKKIQSIPSGMFILPFLLSVLQYTFWPSLFENIGGTTAALFDGSATGFIVGILVFCSATTIQFNKLGDILKHQGTMLVVKLIWALILIFGFLYLFGLEGIWGISAVAFATAIISINPAIYSSILQEYGYKEDSAFYAIMGILCLPAIPIIIFSVYISGGLGSIDFMPIISMLIPLVLGMILGNIDPEFGGFFGGATGTVLFFLGWNLGQGLNLFEAIEAGIPGLLLTIIFIIISIPLFFVDRGLGYEGITGVSMMTIAGMSTAVPASLAAIFPELQQYVTSATAQVLLVVLITAFLAPFLSQKVYEKYGSVGLGDTKAE